MKTLTNMLSGFVTRGVLLLHAIFFSAEANSQELPELIEKWRTHSTIVALDANDATKESHLSVALDQDGISVTFLPHPDQTDDKVVTSIHVPVLNLPGGLRSLRPLLEVNQRRFDDMMTQCGLKTERLPNNLSIRIQIVHAYLDADGTIFFEARVEFTRGSAIVASADFELWKYSNGKFHLLRFPTKWSQGG